MNDFIYQLIYKFVIKINIFNTIMKGKKQNNNEDELKIGQFIKDPMSLKLLILAGTNIRVPELQTISKCTGLIKLDLSNNFLPQIPLKFQVFHHMKILYLHDNQLTSVDIKKTNIQYISLFGNPMKFKEYRPVLVQLNEKLLAIDYNIVTERQRVHLGNQKLPIYSELKWPIVQMTNHLQHEEDYLNLLKAQIFVISNVHKRTLKTECIEQKIRTFITGKKYEVLENENTEEGKIKKKSVIVAAKKWLQYTRLRKKLRAILAKKGKEHLLQSFLERKKSQRSQQVNEIVEAFVHSVRVKMKAREICLRQIRAFKKCLPEQKKLYMDYLNLNEEENIEKNPIKFYFKESQADYLSKVCLFAKKLLFQQKDYDLCDEFNDLFHPTGKKYIIYRCCTYYKDEPSWLMNTIHESINFVLGQDNLDRQHHLYTRKGHKQIQLKNLKKLKESQVTEYKEKAVSSDKKIDYLYKKYDRLLEYNMKNWKILHLVMKIIKYINAGNSKILQTQTAYFQTQLEEKDEEPQKVRMHLGMNFFTKRALAANIIQKFWRRVSAKKKLGYDLLKVVKFSRGQKIVKKWLNNLIFSHRMLRAKLSSYIESQWKDSEVYLHLDIYMNMPEPTNFLRFTKQLYNKQSLYDLIHKNTQIQIVESGGRKWLRICFENAKAAFKVQEELKKYTYRYYYNGFYVKLFTKWEINESKLLEEYEAKIRHLFGFSIEVFPDSKVSRNLWIQNSNPYFLWSQIEPEETVKKFEQCERRNTVISIFIYNKHKRPLKVSCQFTWINPNSIYLNPIKSYIRKATTPKKKSLQKIEPDVEQEYYLRNPLQRHKYQKGKRSSLVSHHQSLTKSHRTRVLADVKLDMLSETLNIRRK